MWPRDFMHPIDLGHKTIADVVVYALQQSALQVAMSPYGVPDLDLLLEPLPQPMFPGNYEGRNRLCVYGEVRAALQWHWCKYCASALWAGCSPTNRVAICVRRMRHGTFLLVSINRTCRTADMLMCVMCAAGFPQHGAECHWLVIC
jgi:hypothetical protein